MYTYSTKYEMNPAYDSFTGQTHDVIRNHIQLRYCNKKLIIQYYDTEYKATKFFINNYCYSSTVVNVPDYCEIQEFDEQTHEVTL